MYVTKCSSGDCDYQMESRKASISKKPFQLSGFTSSPWTTSRRSLFSPKLETSEVGFDSASPAKECELIGHGWSFLKLLTYLCHRISII
jgi:hypothetical protein